MKEVGKSIQSWDSEVTTVKEVISILAEKFKGME